MYWEEDSANNTESRIPMDVVDLVYAIECKALTVDHAHALSSSLIAELNWIKDENAGVHTIHVAESGNGWFRPDNPNELLYPSRRTKFTLRVPNHRIEDAKTLVGKILDVNGNSVRLKNVTVKPLSDIATIFSRYVDCDRFESEQAFMEWALEELASMGIRPKKMLCGTETALQMPSGPLKTRSLMIADLTAHDTILLQQIGLGDYRWMGCGIFLPHKDINEITD